MDALELFLTDEKPDVLSLAEHWCNPYSVKTMTLPGYILADYYCRPSRAHGGSMVYIRAGLSVRNLSVSRFSEEMECEISGILVVACDVKIAIISVYRPGSGDFEIFLDRISVALNYCITSADVIFVCGDLNVDFLKIDSANRKLLVDLMNCFNMNVSSNDPTRVFTDVTGHTSISKVDYVLTNANLVDCNVKVYEPHISDHRAITLEFQINLPLKNHDVSKLVRDLCPQNLKDFEYCISNCDFQEMYKYPHVDECFEVFVNLIQSSFETCCPIKRYVNNANVLKKFTSPEIISAKRDLKNLHWLHINIRSESTYYLYKTAKHSYNNLLRNAKLDFHRNLIDKSTNKNRTVWNLVNTVTGRKSNDQRTIELVVEGVLFDEAKTVAEMFANHFTTVAEISLNRYYNNSLSTSCTTSCMLNNNFFFHPVMDHEVADVLKSLKNDSGVDFVSARILKLIGPDISRHFAYLVNMSVTTGVFPDLLKKATIIPVHKKGDVYDISNYRPISVLSCLSKLFERLVFNRMMKFLDKFQLLTSAQHGFRSGRSTQTGVLEFVEFVYDCLDNGSYVAGLFFDLSKAFDSISFQFILDKCYNLGFRGVFHDWIRSYLEGRVASVRVQDSSSSKHNLKLGVPQGSVLGPLLFLIFINDLPENLLRLFINKSKTCPDLMKILRAILFADDFSLAVTADTLEELQGLCDLLVHCFVEWCYVNAIMINVNKTECVYFSISNNDSTLVIRHSDSIIASKNCTKFLGIYIDRHLKWNSHVDEVCKKLYSSYYALSRVRYLLPLCSLMNVYYSLVFSHLSYNIMVWGNSTETDRVFIIQKRILRMIFNVSPRSSCRPVFLENRILTLASIFILRCLVFAKENEESFVKLSSFHSHNTRNKKILSIPKHKTSKFEMSPKYQCIKLFNHLPSNIKSLNLFKFKKVVKSLLLKKCFYSVNEYYNDSLENV